MNVVEDVLVCIGIAILVPILIVGLVSRDDKDGDDKDENENNV